MTNPLPKQALRWRCDPKTLEFETTADIEPIPGVVGQPSALEALRYGLECDFYGQNVFVRGLSGTGRLTMVRRLLEEMKPACPAGHDRCFVHNFADADQPRLLTLPAGKAREFRRRVAAFVEFIRDGLKEALNAQGLKARRDALEKRVRGEVEALTKPFEEALRGANLALVSIQTGPISQTALFPVVDGKPVPPEEFENLHAQGKITDEVRSKFIDAHESFRKRLAETSDLVRKTRRAHDLQVKKMIEETARAILQDLANLIRQDFPGEDVAAFLGEVIEDVLEHKIGEEDEEEDRSHLYGVNVVLAREENEGCAIVIENSPTLSNLLGGVDREWSPRGPARSDFTMVRAGSLLRADGGYLVMEVRDLLMEPGAWKVLVRTLRSGMLEIVPPELSLPIFGPTLKPQPIPIKVRVILLGDADMYYLLDGYDPDFGHLFKVLADFDPEIDRNEEGVRKYAGVLARIARDESLLPFDRGAVAALAEHGARIAARAGKLTSRFGRVADIAREASFLAKKAGMARIRADEVKTAVKRTRARADLPSRKFREYIADGTIRIETKGAVVGQINGLAVVHAGPLTYGFPARITATIGAGSAGVINIEREAALSGAIHTKGFYILGGLLRNLLQTDHPLAFSASIAFEQSYGGIDGDSASGAEMCCLLSALTNVPLRQDLAMTGAIDQMGHIQAIGAVTEKIEGFYDACRDIELTGTQGVLIPRSNAGDLMLREDVVEACARGQFHVYAVGTVQEALEVLTGKAAGERTGEGQYPEGTLLDIALKRAREFWVRASRGENMQELADSSASDAESKEVD
jgi:ATP-dependent Lon protease